MPYWRLFYHCIWSTKERLPTIVPAIEKPLHKAILAKAKDPGAFPYAVGGTEDHVHLVVSVPPRLSLAHFVGQVKGASSHLANHALHAIGAFSWQAEYGVVSFSGRQLDRIVRYVLNQRQHHAEGSTIAIFERCSADAPQPQPPS